MSINFKALDDIPTFTGEEDVREQIQKLYNYIYVLKEQIRYLLQNIGVENMNSKAWKSMQEDTIAGQSREDVFNKLTDNGRLQGIYEQDGKWYINAELVEIIKLIAKEVRSEEMTEDGERRSVVISNGRLYSTINGQLAYDLVTHLGLSYLQLFQIDASTEQDINCSRIGSGMMSLGGTFDYPVIQLNANGETPELTLIGEGTKKLFWRGNGDGTFSLSGR